MASDETKGDQSPETPVVPAEPSIPVVPDTSVSYSPVTDTPNYSSDYTYESSQPGNTMRFGPQTQIAPSIATPVAQAESSGGGRKFLPPPPGGGDGGDEEDGMLRMSFLEHLEELRVRLFWAIGGFAVIFLASLTFCNRLWLIIQKPATDALKQLKVNPPNLTQLTPMEGFNVIWVKVPVLVSIFLSSPWLLYQVWAFVAPGLYKRERRWAVPFVTCTAGLFIAGGLFAYYVAFRFGLVFLLGIGRDINVTPLVSINEYFDLFVNVTLGIGIVFELPVLIFFLTLLRIVTPSFLVKNSRYAILIIVIIAAIVTPTPDVFNLLLFATPMIVLFYVGVLASYLLVLNREGKKLPWLKILAGTAIILLLVGFGLWYVFVKFHLRVVPNWPFVMR